MSKEMLYAPTGWGSQISKDADVDPDLVMALALAETNDQRRAMMASISESQQAEVLVRQMLEQAGFAFTFVDTPEELPDEIDGKVVRGRQIRWQEQREWMQRELPEIPIPETQDFSEYYADPFLPVVVKSPEVDAGMFKYLLETPLQIRKMKYFLEKGAIVGKLSPEEITDLKQRSGLLDASEGDTKEAWEHYKKLANQTLNPITGQPMGEDFFVFQQYIPTPSKRYTTYRILASAWGDVLAGGLLYSGTSKPGELHQTRSLGDQEKIQRFRTVTLGLQKTSLLRIEESNTCLYDREFLSNLAQNGDQGGVIVLSGNENSKQPNEYEREILKDHGLDTEIPQIPEELKQYSTRIAQEMASEIGLVVGIDFIQSAKDGKYYWLETNGGPGLKVYQHSYGYETYPQAYIELHRQIINKAF